MWNGSIMSIWHLTSNGNLFYCNTTLYNYDFGPKAGAIFWKQASRVPPSPYVLEFINAYLLFFGCIFNHILVTFLETLFYCNLKVYIGAIYIYTHWFKISDSLDHRWRSYNRLKCVVLTEWPMVLSQMWRRNTIPKALNAAYGHKPHGHNIT